MSSSIYICRLHFIIIHWPKRIKRLTSKLAIFYHYYTLHISRSISKTERPTTQIEILISEYRKPNSENETPISEKKCNKFKQIPIIIHKHCNIETQQYLNLIIFLINHYKLLKMFFFRFRKFVFIFSNWFSFSKLVFQFLK